MSAEASFSAAAARLAGAAQYLFGWTPETFWEATPAELGAILAFRRGEGAQENGGLDRTEFTQLQEMFPDG